jgi:hypothetical protein
MAASYLQAHERHKKLAAIEKKKSSKVVSEESHYFFGKSSHERFLAKAKEVHGDITKGKTNAHGQTAYHDKSGKQIGMHDIDGEGDHTYNVFKKTVKEDLGEKVGIFKKFINGKWVTLSGNTIVKEDDECAPHNAVDLSAYETEYDEDMGDLELSDEEIDHMINSLSDDEIADDYDEDEVGLVDDETGEELPTAAEEAAIDEESIMEVLSRAERMKAKFRIRRSSAKRERATKVALKRYSNTATINKRARRLAVKLMKKRLLRGRDPAKISVGEKERIERTLEKRKAVIGRVAQKLTSRVRKVEKARLSHTKYTQGTPNVAF